MYWNTASLHQQGPARSASGCNVLSANQKTVKAYLQLSRQIRGSVNKTLRRGINRRRYYIFLYLVFLLVANYAIQDFMTSRNVSGDIGLDRSMVHVALFGLILWMGAYYCFTIVKSAAIVSPPQTAMWLIVGWIGSVNLICGTFSWEMAIHMGLSMLWVLSFYFFSSYIQRFPKSWRTMKFCIALMFVFYVFSNLFAVYAIRQNYHHVAVVTLVYGVLVFMPWIALLKNANLRRFAAAAVFIVVLLSMKRGAFIVFPLMLSTDIIAEAIVRKKGMKSALKAVFLMVLFTGGVLAADQWSGGYLSQRFSPAEMAGGSGRVELYNHSIDDIVNRSTMEFLCGRGSGSSILYLGTGAHNEWLEFIFNYGAIGGALYFFMILSLLWRTSQLVLTHSPYAHAHAMAVTYLVLVGLFSGIYFVHSTFYIMAFFGAIDGLLNTSPFTMRAARRRVMPYHRIEARP
jgi:hypothetical protein